MNCGAVFSHSENAFVFQVGKFVDIKNKIIPFFNALSILPHLQCPLFPSHALCPCSIPIPLGLGKVPAVG